MDGLGQIIHERLFTVELKADASPCLKEADVLGDMSPAAAPEDLPDLASLPEATAWLSEKALIPFVNEVRGERLAEVERIAALVEVSLNEVLHRVDAEIGRAIQDRDNNVTGAEGRLAQAESRHAEVLARRQRRVEEFKRQRALTLQGVERLASVLRPAPSRRPDPGPAAPASASGNRDDRHAGW